MPTPDASAFTTQKKYNAIGERFNNAANQGVKPFSHLYMYVPKSTGLPDFLPSFQNKVVTPFTFTRVNTTQRPAKTGLTYYRPRYIR